MEAPSGAGASGSAGPRAAPPKAAAPCASAELEALERLRRSASCVSLVSSEGDRDAAGSWAFEPSSTRLAESQTGGIWALARREADGAVFYGTQAGDVRVWRAGLAEAGAAHVAAAPSRPCPARSPCPARCAVAVPAPVGPH